MKSTAINWKYLKYLFWLGPGLAIAGIVAGLVSGIWVAIPATLIVTGIAVSIAGIAVEGKAVRSFWGQRSTQAGTNALAAVIAVIVILGLVNFLGVRYARQVDLTENQIFTLAPQSQEVVRELEQPVKLWIFDITPDPTDRALLDNYQRQGSQFSYEYVDPQAQPTVAQEFDVQQIGEVYLEQGSNRRPVQTISPNERLSERRLTNALVQLGSDRQPKVYFLQGHGERALTPGQGGLSEALSRLQEENFAAEPLNLAQNPQVPDDAAVLILAGPQRPLLETEISALNAYLEGQSGLMVLADPNTDPGLNDVLQGWGIELSDLLIIDPNGQAAGLNPTVTLITDYGDHPITGELGNGISIFPLSGPVGLDPVDGISAIPLLITSEQVQAQPIPENGELTIDPDAEVRGALNLGIALSRPVAAEAATDIEPAPDADPETDPELDDTAIEGTADDESSSPEARLVVIGNSSFMIDGLLNQQLNSDVFLNAVNWLSQEDSQPLAIRPKEMTNRRIVLTAQQQILLFVMAIAIFPLAGFGVAIGLWLRRR